MTAYAEPKRLSDVLLVELSHLSRNVANFITNTAIALGMVLGRVLLGAATSAAKSGGNTGNGTLVLDATTPVLAGAKAGVYLVRILRAAVAAVATTPAVPAQKALAQLVDPSGVVLGVFEVSTSGGTTIANLVKFKITEGATPFAVGDGFDITIAEGSNDYAPLDPSAVDGTQIAVAIAGQDIASSASSPKGVAIEFVAAVASSGLAWPDDISDAQKALAIKQLEERFIVIKTDI